MVTIDEAIELAGSFGRFQKFVVGLICMAFWYLNFQTYIMYFATLESSWTCVKNSTYCLLIGSRSSDDLTRCDLPRDQWYYTERNRFSVATWFDVPCEQHWMLGATTTVYFIGIAVGANTL